MVSGRGMDGGRPYDGTNNTTRSSDDGDGVDDDEGGIEVDEVDEDRDARADEENAADARDDGPDSARVSLRLGCANLSFSRSSCSCSNLATKSNPDISPCTGVTCSS